MIKIRHESGPIQNTITSTYRVSKGCLMDSLEQFFIQKYYHEHKLIREQVPGEIRPLFILLFDRQIRHATT